MKDYNTLISSKQPVLVEFYASWCPHCQRMMPVVEQVKEKLAGKAEVYQFDIDKYGDLADRQKVESVPTFILYRDGAELWRQAGEVPGETLVEQVRKAGG